MKFNCCNRFMDMLRAAYDMATHAIKGVQLGSDPEIKYPDGAGIVKLNVPDAGTLEEIEAYIEVSKATDERLSLDIDRLNVAKQDKLIAGTNITISEDNVISATGGGGSGSDFVAQNNDGSIMFYKDGVKQAELTEGANITISAEGVISATGGGSSATPTADEVLLTDGRSVQDGIDSIEDELGDLGTSGTVQSRLKALEESTANLDTELTGKQDSLSDSQMSAVNSGITSLKVDKIDRNSANITQLTSVVDTATDDITALKQADIKLSKAYSGFEVTKTTGKVGLTMTAVDGMSSASGTILQASSGINIINGYISATGDGWEEVDLLTWDGDWEVGDEFKVIFNVRLSCSGSGSWGSGSVVNPSIQAGNDGGGTPIYGVLLDSLCRQAAIFWGGMSTNNVAALLSLSYTASATNFYNGGSAELFCITGIAFNGNVCTNLSLSITANNISNYVYKLWRRRP